VLLADGRRDPRVSIVVSSAGTKLAAGKFLDSAGKLATERKSAPQSSDVERLARELQRRGLQEKR
jgi:hypothetical protein